MQRVLHVVDQVPHQVQKHVLDVEEVEKRRNKTTAHMVIGVATIVAQLTEKMQDNITDK